MLTLLLSPAKTFANNLHLPKDCTPTQPLFEDHTQTIVKTMQAQSPTDLQKMMGISQAIADLNVGRYQRWDQEAKFPALAYFKGDVYKGLQTEDFTKEDFEYAQKHIATLSGLYGFLRPLDQIQAYRLEMGTRLEVDLGDLKRSTSNLYQFWSQTVTTHLNQLPTDYIINAASQEYAKVIDHELLNKKFVQTDFKTHKNGTLKTIGIHAKRARGLFARYAVKNQITSPQDLQNFDLEGWTFDPTLSQEDTWVFVKKI